MEIMRCRGRQKHKTPHFNNVSSSSSSSSSCCCFFYFFAFITISTFLGTIGSTVTTCLDSRSILFADADIHFQKASADQGYKNKMVHQIRHGSLGRRLLGGLGSSPPRCTSKCGTCTPCKPVHVPVPPGTPVTTEYYPEAWRCKCGNRLYMP